jgi:hypothetical protein
LGRKKERKKERINTWSSLILKVLVLKRNYESYSLSLSLSLCFESLGGKAKK